MPRQGWNAVSLRGAVVTEIDDFIKSDKGKKLGINSRAELITRAVTDLLEKYQPRFEHLNMMDEHVKVVDFTLNRIATVYFKHPGKVWCDVCEKDSCEHVEYALEQDDIKKELEKHDWKF